MQKLKRVVIKEELLALTGDFRLAIVLNQLMYWSERVNDFDKFIKEEKERLKITNDQESGKIIEYQNGWIWKKAEELVSECMLLTLNNKGESKNVSDVTMRSYIKTLVENGWVFERNNPNPKYKFDKTKQYRVNLKKINDDLKKLGYTLQGYKFEEEIAATPYMTEPEKFRFEGEKTFSRTLKTLLPKSKNLGAIPETTTEITNINNNNEEKNVVIEEENNKNKIKLISEIIGHAKDLGIPVDDVLANTLLKVANRDIDRIVNALKAAKNQKTKIQNLSGFLVDAVKKKWSPGPEVTAGKTKINTTWKANSKTNLDDLYEL